MPLPVLVTNKESGPLVFTDANTKAFVEWAGSGDESGEDVQVVPEEFFQNPNFIKAITRGSLEVENPEDNPELAATLQKVMSRTSITAQRAAANARKANASQAGSDAIENVVDNDILGDVCIGPDTRGGEGKCGQSVTLTAAQKKKNDTPPLCAKHKGLAMEFVPTADVTGDKQTIKWVRATLGRREKEITS